MIFGWFSFDPFILQKILQRFQWHLIQFKKSTVSSSCCSFYAIRIYTYQFLCCSSVIIVWHFVYVLYFQHTSEGGVWIRASYTVKMMHSIVFIWENDKQSFISTDFLSIFHSKLFTFLFLLLIFILCYNYFSIIHKKTKKHNKPSQSRLHIFLYSRICHVTPFSFSTLTFK